MTKVFGILDLLATHGYQDVAQVLQFHCIVATAVFDTGYGIPVDNSSQRNGTHVVEDAPLSQDDALLLLAMVDAGLVTVAERQDDDVEALGFQGLA
jgi:hypothetical protein